jgi:hypothetical protein
MDNIENYLYIAFAVIYVISRLIKARSKQKEVEQQEQNQQTTNKPIQRQAPPKKTFTFDDILKEFERSMGGEDLPDEKPEPVLERKQEMLRQNPVTKPAPKPVARPTIYESFEGVKYEDQMSYKEEEATSLLGRNQNFVIHQAQTNYYAKMLQDPNGIRDAIVINEIINRKYF